MAMRASEKVLIAGMCLLTGLNAAAYYQSELREARRMELDLLREQSVVEAIAATQTLKSTCYRAIRQKSKLGHQLHRMRHMPWYSDEFKAGFEKLREILKDPDAGEEGSGKGKGNGE
ncbi:hypothetical protein F4811DRAFT_558368 [Daldinia bambusicola]|nr:hypothetical protein F4811DRAFT_558368 [Daldinia bambusicola]